MTQERQDGWYWVVATAQDNGRWQVAMKRGDHFYYGNIADSNPYRVSPRIPSPDEPNAAPLGDPPASAWLRAWLASPHPPHGERRLSSGEVGSERLVLEAYDALRNAAPGLLAVVAAAKELDEDCLEALRSCNEDKYDALRSALAGLKEG